MPLKKAKNALLRFIQGMIMGGGAILPGVSGGVLCAAFGLYMPLMKLCAHPKRELPLQWRLWLTVGAGWLCGFALFAAGVMYLLDIAENTAMALFAGLILGTLPALHREAHKDSSGNAPENPTALRKRIRIGIMTLAFLLSLAFFVLLTAFESTGALEITPGFFWFAVSGAILGLGMVIPGLTSSSLLMMLGLYKPMTDGIAALQPAVLLPVGIGLAAAVIATSRLVSFIFTRFYTEAYYAVIGIVLSSTLIIIPRSFTSVWNFILCAAVFFGGIFCSFLADKKLQKNDE